MAKKKKPTTTNLYRSKGKIKATIEIRRTDLESPQLISMAREVTVEAANPRTAANKAATVLVNVQREALTRYADQIEARGQSRPYLTVANCLIVTFVGWLEEPEFVLKEQTQTQALFNMSTFELQPEAATGFDG